MMIKYQSVKVAYEIYTAALMSIKSEKTFIVKGTSWRRTIP